MYACSVCCHSTLWCLINISNVPHISLDKVDYRNDLISNGWRRILLQEPRTIVLMKGLVRTFSEPEDLVMAAS